MEDINIKHQEMINKEIRKEEVADRGRRKLIGALDGNVGKLGGRVLKLFMPKVFEKMAVAWEWRILGYINDRRCS